MSIDISDRAFWIITDEHKIVFETEEEALDYDFINNPEKHCCEDESFLRKEGSIYQVEFRDLLPEQQDYLLIKYAEIKF